MNNFIQRLESVLLPKVNVAGIEISDNSVNLFFLQSKDEKAGQISEKIPDGVVVGGRVKDKTSFVNVLKKLRNHFNHVDVPVVVSISDANVYSQTFSVPDLKGDALAEAVKLNLQMISPLDFSSSYSDWQSVDDLDKERSSSGEAEIIGSFVERGIVDDIHKALTEAGFSPIAFEQKAFSLYRLITNLDHNYSHEFSYLIIFIGSEGISLSVLKNGHFYFNRFSPWDSLIKGGSQREISFSEFSDSLIQECHKVTNFYNSRSSDNLKKAYVIGSGLDEQTKKIIETNFPILVDPIDLKGHQSLPSNWFVSLGAALRGEIPRAVDTDISLAPEGTESQYFHSQTISFLSLWRTVLIVFFMIIIISFSSTYSFLSYYSRNLTNSLEQLSVGQNYSDLALLKKEAESFNLAIKKAVVAREQQTRWAESLSSVFEKSAPNISITRLYLQSLNSPISLTATTDSESSAVNFKSKIEQIQNIKQIDLPISSITPAPDGSGIVFKMTFTADYLNL